jgi:hypothetical protein
MQHFNALRTVSSILGLFYALITFNCTADNNSINDPKFNGKWKFDDVSFIYEMELNDGNFETFRNREPIFKGTYTAINGSYDSKITHFFGSRFSLDFYLEPPLDKKWYSRNELRTLLLSNYFITDTEIADNFIFNQPTVTFKYSISNNKLFLFDDEYGEGVYIKE